MGDPTGNFPRDWTLTIGGVPCGIYQDGGDGITESNTETGREATVILQCYWNQREQAIAGLLGTVTWSNGAVTRTDPAQYPLSAYDQNDVSPVSVFQYRLVCTSISSVRGIKWWTDVDGSDQITDPPVPGWGGYVYALITAEFTTPTWTLPDYESEGLGGGDLLGYSYSITKIKASGEVFAPPTGSFVWAPGQGYDNVPIPSIGAAQIRSRGELSVTRVRMPIVPINAIVATIGGVNSLPLSVGSYENIYQYPRGSVLFNNYIPEPRSDPQSGAIVFDIEFVFLINGAAANGANGAENGAGAPLDWNQFIGPKGEWLFAVTKTTGLPVFQYVDFTPLFSNTIS